MSDKKQNPLRRFLGKIKEQQSKNGVFYKVVIDNPSPMRKEKDSEAMVEDKYNKGVLLWCDNETGKKYLVKQLGLHGVGAEAAAKGFTNSISIDLDDTYQVEDLG